MGHEISYRTWACGIYARDAASDAEDNAAYLDRIEQKIFAYMCMSPEQMGDRCDEDEDNASYLSRVWNDLKEQWREAHHMLVVAKQIKDALEDNEYKVVVCPECLHQLKNSYDRGKGDFVWKCPEHGTIETPKVATLNNVEEDD